MWQADEVFRGWQLGWFFERDNGSAVIYHLAFHLATELRGIAAPNKNTNFATELVFSVILKIYVFRISYENKKGENRG